MISRKKSTTIKLLIILVVGHGILLYTIALAWLRMSQLKTALIFGDIDHEAVPEWDWKFMDDLERNHSLQHHGYFVDTVGCRMPRFEIVDNNVAKFIFREKPVDCGKPLTRSNYDFVWIDLNETEIRSIYGVETIDKLECEYQPFYRVKEFENEYAKPEKIVTFRLGDVVRVFDEYIRVICRDKDKNNTKIYEDYHFFLQEKRLTNKLHHLNFSRTADGEFEKAHTKRNEPMSVMVLGLDGVSRLNFHRQMNESANYLLDELRAIEFFGYNKVADNSYPNLMPVLTGLDSTELRTACRPNHGYTFDGCNIIWNAFKAKNFLTAYGEDYAYDTLFQYGLPGFKDQPTDYNLGPVQLEMRRNIANRDFGDTKACFGKRSAVDVLFEYMRKFLNVVKNRLYFSFFWESNYTHDLLNSPTFIDKDLADFLRLMQSTGALDNLFLVVMSDHGIRYGDFRKTYQGMIEERQPLLFLVPPKRFSQQYPEAMRNLVTNRRRLMSNFDIYETLLDLSELESLESRTIKVRSNELRETEPMPRGISLFLPIPETRTCYDAAIAPHWCTCREPTELAVNDSRVTKVARFVVDNLNKTLTPHTQCQRLQLNAILSANLEKPSTRFGGVVNQFVDIVVRIQTKPGLGEFEATVRVYDSKPYELTGPVSRTNLYRKQSHCVRDHKMKLYCFCHNQI